MTDKSKQSQLVAEVILVGPGPLALDKRTRLLPQVKVGDRVVYRLGAEIQVDGEMYVLCREAALIAKLEGDCYASA